MTSKTKEKTLDISTASGLRKELANLYGQLKRGDVSDKDAAELTNIAGKMISTAKCQVAYYALRKEDVPNITFLQDDTDVSQEK